MAGKAGKSDVIGDTAADRRLLFLFICGTMLTSGLLYPMGLAVLDELALGAALLWTLRRVRLPRAPIVLTKGSLPWAHDRLFNLLIAYVSLEAVRGAILLESPRKLRWVLLFILVFFAARIWRRLPDRTVTARAVRDTIVRGGFLYLAMYSGCGLMFELIFGISRYELQPVSGLYTDNSILLWGTSAYALFPVVLIVPCALLSLQDDNPRTRRLAILTVLLAVATVIYYDSRAGLIVTVGFSALAAPFVGIRRIGWIGLASILFAAFYFLGPWTSADYTEAFFQDLFNTGGALWSSSGVDEGVRDLDRYMEIQVAFLCIEESWITTLFGFGYRMSGYVIGDHLMDTLSIFDPAQLLKLDRDFSNVGTEAFAAWIIDTGLVGVALLTGVLGVCFLRVTRSPISVREKLVLAAVPILLFCWLFVIDFRDIVLFYLMIMPSGFLMRIAKCVQSPGPGQ